MEPKTKAFFDELLEKTKFNAPRELKKGDKCNDIIDEAVELMLSFIKSTPRDELIACIRRLPTLIYGLEFDADNKEDKELFEKAMFNAVNVDDDFFESVAQSFYAHYIAFMLNQHWFDTNKAFLTDELFEKLPNNHVSQHFIKCTAKHFIENSKDRDSMVCKIHEMFKSNNGNISVPDTVAIKMKDYITRGVYEYFARTMAENTVTYYSVSRSYPFKPKITIDDVFDPLLNDEEISLVISQAASKSTYSEVSAINRFKDRVTRDQLEALLTRVVEQSYKSNDRFKSNYLKGIDNDVLSKHAELIISVSVWGYTQLPEEARERTASTIDFSEHLGLIPYNPNPESISNELWIEALKSNEISHKHIPAHLTTGEQAFTEDEWFEIIKSVKGGDNDIFKGLVKFHKEAVTERLIEKVSELKGTKAGTHQIVSTFLAEKAFNKRKIKEVGKAIDIAKNGDARSTAKEINRLHSLNMASNETIGEILEVFGKQA